MIDEGKLCANSSSYFSFPSFSPFAFPTTFFGVTTQIYPRNFNNFNVIWDGKATYEHNNRPLNDQLKKLDGNLVINVIFSKSMKMKVEELLKRIKALKVQDFTILSSMS